MNKYLLLRDNKQTGPYTVEELVKKGLKPYDLVWLDGRSAAWRYPSEIDELKSFAPVVEEQPYDRFYKRSSSTQEHAIHATQQQLGKEEQSLPAAVHNSEQHFSSQTATAVPEKTEQAPVTAAANTIQETNANIPLAKTGTGKVYVTLPAGFRQQQPVLQPVTVVAEKATVDQSQPTTAGVQETKPQEESGVSQEDARALEARAAALAQSIQAAAEAAAKKQSAQEAIQQTGKLSAVASTKVAKTIQSAEHTTNFSSLINKQQQEDTVPVIPMRNQSERKRLLFMRSIVAACLLLGGIVIGMALNYGKGGSANQQVLDQLVQRLQEREAQRQAGVQSDLPPTDDNTKPPVNPDDYAEEDHSPVEEQSALPENPARELAVKEKTVPPVVSGNDAPITYEEKDPSGMKITPAVVTNKEEPRPVREADIATAREKIFQMVHVAASPFDTGVLGGISNLYFTVSNTSSFPIDQIELEIKYLGPEKRVVKVQRLIFNDVAAGALKTLEAPRTTRGVSIDYVITKINSRALGIAHAGF
jgi:hypothetical protein